MTSKRLNGTASAWVVFACFAAALAPARAARAAGEPGITVSGQGQAKGRPTVAEITATVSGEAELAADAVVKYRDMKREATKRLDGLKLPGLSIESSGYSLTQAMDPNQQQMIARGMAVAASPKQKMQVVEQLRIVIKDLDKAKDDGVMETVLKVLDTGRDAGLVVGPPPRNMNYYPPPSMPGLVIFKIPDPAALREQAYKQAIDDARSKAERVASLAGVKLGRILSVQDNGTLPPNMPQIYNPYNVLRPDDTELASNNYGDITIKVNLSVLYDIQK